MKQFVQSLLLGWLALQGFACAGADHSAEENDETALSAFDVAPADGSVAAPESESDSDEAPQSVELLSPVERDAQLGGLTDPRGAPADAQSLGDLVLRARLLERGVLDVQVTDLTDLPREAGRR